MKKGIFNLLSMSILFFVNQGYAQQINSHLQANSSLQNHVCSILKENIKKIDAINGQIIIMDCKSGEIKAMVNLVSDKSGVKPTTSQLSQPTGLMRPISLLAALEQGKVNLNDSVDTKEGMIDISGYLLEDYNWRSGGNGKTTIQQGFLSSSNIATYLSAKQTFGKDYSKLYKTITNMGYGLPQDSLKATLPIPYDNITLAKFATGKTQQVTPLQMLTFYNAIANNGKMIKPTFQKGDTTIIKEQIVSKENISTIQQLLIQKGVTYKAFSDKVPIAGEQGVAIAKEDRDNAVYCLQFCGYYPSNNPKYSIIVTLNKQGLPASGGMVGEMVKQIIEL